MVVISRFSTLILAIAAAYTDAAPSAGSRQEKFDKVVTANGSDEPVNSHNKDPYGLGYSGKGLTEPEYNERNLQWLRCEPRFQDHEYRFTMGGSWISTPNELRKILYNQRCGLGHFEHRFDNKKFGDGKLELNFYLPDCDMEDIIAAAVQLVRKNQRKFKQKHTKLQLYNCPGYGTDSRVVSEQEAFADKELKEAEHKYKVAKELHTQMVQEAKNGGRIQFKQFSDV